eukprot:TRINITY_DN14530_c0_g1_i1.p2 TRINITY_DN14530_c0_g1~~TRINITY_DN14530_c0_g1_i1.p2  ORF type:complete len:295 (+),score=53.29 TRINITY_DN14530_c0_g1_i1:480-1364(+)
MLVTSLMSLRTMSVAVVTLIKAFAIICTALGDHLLFGHPLTMAMSLAFVLMFIGSCLGGGTDAWVTPDGLIYSLLNVACTSGYQLYMKGLVEDLQKQLGRWGPVYYNNLLSLPLLVVPMAASFTGPNGWWQSLQKANPWAHGWLVLMCLLSPLMTMSSFWCITATSPTTYAVVGGMNKVPLAVLGMLIFDQWPNAPGAIGIGIGLSGGFVYAYAMHRSQRDSTVSRQFLTRLVCALLGFTVVFFVALDAMKSHSRSRSGILTALRQMSSYLHQEGPVGLLTAARSEAATGGGDR